ncbi:MAG: SMC family ATPase [Acidimicrobiaceae bacterium]|nr:SMC family ATPase [Acidimicrobiaceae bacterium]
MRPHRLAFSALGPYPGEVVIDFDQLRADGLFLIWGPTGGGKTFLLDALCFALFGEVPGERHHDTLRSDYASPDASPWAELEFTCGADADGGCWRIQRTPRHERAKRRGSGTTSIAARATLERRDADEWRAVAQKIPDVNAEVMRLLGLTASQFQQVVLLPQGRFEKVLQSRTDEREHLLRTLFDTDMFASISSWLDDEARQRNDAVIGLDRDLGDLRDKAAERWQSVHSDQVGDAPPSAIADAPKIAADDSDRNAHGDAEDQGDADAADDDADDDVSNAAGESADAAVENADTADGSWPADQADLDDLVERAGLRARRAADAATHEQDRLEEARNVNDAVQRDAERWDRRAALRQCRDQLAEAEAGIEVDRTTLNRAIAAEHLRQQLHDEADAREQLDVRLSEVSERYEVLHSRWGEAPSLPAGWELPPADDPQLPDGLALVATALAQHRDKVAALIEDAATAAERESDAIAERQAAADQTTRSDEFNAAAAEHERQCNEAAGALRDARSAAEQVFQLEDAAIQANDRAEAAAELRTLRPAQKTAEEALHGAKETKQARREAWLDLRERYLNGIAAELAGELNENQPCPVCGSTDHPNRAQPDDDSVGFEEVESAEAEVEAAAEAEDTAREALRSVSERVAVLTGRAGAAASDPGAAQEAAESAAAARDAALGLASQVPKVEEVLGAHADAAAEAKENAQQADLEATAASERARAAQNDADALRKRIEDSIGHVDPAAVISKISDVDAALSEVRSAAQHRERASTQHATQATALSKQLESSTFSTPDDARSALLDDGERSRLTSEIQRHDQATHDTQRDLSAEDLQELPDARPDTDAAQDALGAASETASIAAAHHTRAADAHEAISDWADQHRRTAAEHVRARAEADLWTTVADRCGGRTTPRVSLQRWVLSAYLEQICERANKRLSEMTGGRYRLGVHRDQERHGAKGGLGLRVHDAYTGAEREVSTLSGGETFQASLALALGVADVVTARTGGVRLDVLFVDEGFGTLDSEALQLAMDELDRLREGGRAVGLISHVAELRERIRTGIEVRPAGNGSEISVGAFPEV